MATSQYTYDYGDPMGGAPGLEGKTLPQREAEDVINTNVPREMVEHRLANISDSSAYFNSCTPDLTNMNAILHEVVFMDDRDISLYPNDEEGNPNCFTNFAGIKCGEAAREDRELLGDEEAIYEATMEHITILGIAGQSSELNNTAKSLPKFVTVINGIMASHNRGPCNIDAGRLYRAVMPRRDNASNKNAIFQGYEPHEDRPPSKILAQIVPIDNSTDGDYTMGKAEKHANYLLGRLKSTDPLRLWGAAGRKHLKGVHAMMTKLPEIPNDDQRDSAEMLAWMEANSGEDLDTLAAHLSGLVRAINAMKYEEEKHVLGKALISVKNDATCKWYVNKVN
jgi:hypothetical protein